MKTQDEIKAALEARRTPKERKHVSFVIEYAQLKFSKEKALGRGGFGIVRKAQYRTATVAVKQLFGHDFSEAAQKEFNAEAEVMAQLRFPNVIQFYGYCDAPQRCLVMEYMPQGSLRKVLNEKLKNKTPLEWSFQLKIATDIASGLAFLHAEQVLHRDIKSMNVLLDDQFRAKLTDFGLSKIKSESKISSVSKNNTVGTLAWMAPELFQRRAVYTPKADIYSLGVTLWELVTGNMPFADAHDPSIIPAWVIKGEREEIPKACPTTLATLIEACWTGDPKARPDAEEVTVFLQSAQKKDQDFTQFLLTYRAENSRSQKFSESAKSQGYRSNQYSGNVQPPQKSFHESAKSQDYRSNNNSENIQVPSQSFDESARSQDYRENLDSLLLHEDKKTPKETAILKQFDAKLKITKSLPKVDAEELSIFLKLMVEGQQESVEKMLNVNRDLLLVPGTVTDWAGRTFKQITGFQYAVWALDWHMWKMLLKYFKAYDLEEAAREQAQGFETGAWVGEHGVHVSWQRLLDAQQTYIDNYDAWDGKQCNTHWVQQVGGAQLYLPAHVLHEYCHPTRSFDPCPKFEEEALPRSLICEQWNGKGWVKEAVPVGKLGKDIGLCRAMLAGVYVYSLSLAVPTHVEEGKLIYDLFDSIDRLAVSSLCCTRIHQRDALVASLTSRDRADARRVA